MLTNEPGMNKRRLIFFAIFGAYQLLVFIFTSYIDAQKQDLGVLTSMYNFIYLFKYGASVGLILFFIDFIWSWRENKTAQKDQEALGFEVNNLKAKVYDLQEANKPQPEPTPDTDVK